MNEKQEKQNDGACFMYALNIYSDRGAPENLRPTPASSSTPVPNHPQPAEKAPAGS